MLHAHKILNSCQKIEWKPLHTTATAHWLGTHVWMEPGIRYFQNQLTFSLQLPPSVKKAQLCVQKGQLFSPHKLQVMKVNVTALDDFRVFPLMNSNSVLDGLKAELPVYLTKISWHNDPNLSSLDGGKRMRMRMLSHVGWSAVAHQIFLNPTFISVTMLQHPSCYNRTSVWWLPVTFYM